MALLLVFILTDSCTRDEIDSFLGVVLTVNPHLSSLWRLSFQRFKWLEEAETFTPQEA